MAAEVVEEVVAVPAGAPKSDLRKPRPDGFGTRVDGYRPRGVEDSARYHIVTRHAPIDLIAGRSPTEVPRAVEPKEQAGCQNDRAGNNRNHHSATPSAETLLGKERGDRCRAPRPSM